MALSGQFHNKIIKLFVTGGSGSLKAVKNT